MQPSPTVIAVDAGGIYCGDLRSAAETVPLGQTIYDAFFCTPIRRARQLTAGSGIIVDCDDGQYEVTLFESADDRELPAGHETLWRASLYLRIQNDELTFCDAMCLSKREDVLTRDDTISPAHAVRIPVTSGCYEAELEGRARPADATEDGFRLLFSEEDHDAWWELYRARLRGALPKERAQAESAEIQSRARRVMCGVVLTLVRPAEIPKDYDPAELVLEMPKLQAANLFLRKPKKKGL